MLLCAYFQTSTMNKAKKSMGKKQWFNTGLEKLIDADILESAEKAQLVDTAVCQLQLCREIKQLADVLSKEDIIGTSEPAREAKEKCDRHDLKDCGFPHCNGAYEPQSTDCSEQTPFDGITRKKCKPFTKEEIEYRKQKWMEFFSFGDEVCQDKKQECSADFRICGVCRELEKYCKCKQEEPEREGQEAFEKRIGFECPHCQDNKGYTKAEEREWGKSQKGLTNALLWLCDAVEDVKNLDKNKWSIARNDIEDLDKEYRKYLPKGL